MFCLINSEYFYEFLDILFYILQNISNLIYKNKKTSFNVFNNQDNEYLNNQDYKEITKEQNIITNHLLIIILKLSTNQNFGIFLSKFNFYSCST